MGNKWRACIKSISFLEGTWGHVLSHVSLDPVVRKPKIYTPSWEEKPLFIHINYRQLISQRYSHLIHLYLIHEKLITWDWISVDLSGLISTVSIQFSHRLWAWARQMGGYGPHFSSYNAGIIKVIFTINHLLLHALWRSFLQSQSKCNWRHSLIKRQQ